MKKILAAVMLIVNMLSLTAFADDIGQNSLISSNLNTINADKPVTIIINGEKIENYTYPVIVDNSVLVPSRVVTEKLGIKVGWNTKSKQITLSKDNQAIEMLINSNISRINGRDTKMQTSPRIINGTIVVPLRFVAEFFNMEVKWKADEKTVAISDKMVSINNISSKIRDNKLEIFINADGVINNFSTVEQREALNLTVNLSKVLIKDKKIDHIVQSDYVKSISASQNDTNPGNSSLVIEMSYWTDYEIKLSDNKKTLIMIFDNSLAVIDSVSLKPLSSSDDIIVNINHVREPKIAVNEKGNTIVDIPFAQINNKKFSVAQSTYLKSVELVQLDHSVRLNIDTFKECAMEVNKNIDPAGFTLAFSSLESNGVGYNNAGVPKLTINSENIYDNYYNYNYKECDDKFIFSTPSTISNLIDTNLIINDRHISYIEINNIAENTGTEIIIHKNDSTKYRVNTIENESKLVIGGISPNNITIHELDKKIREKLIVIDAGHGGDETGAVSETVYEKDLNLDISIRLSQLLDANNFKCQLTRESDQKVIVNKRAEMANNAGASLFVSIHNNGGNADQNGTMTLFYPGFFDDIYGISGERIAQVTQEELTAILGTKDLGIWKRPRLVVLNSTVMPSVLAEVAYVTNSENLGKLANVDFRQKAAQALYNAIVKTLEEMVTAQEISVKDKQPRNINGFSLPAKNTSKCEYGAANQQSTPMYDLTIYLDYAKELNNSATITEQINESAQVLGSKLDAALVAKITQNLTTKFKDYNSHIWAGDDKELTDENYIVQIKCMRYSGKAVIQVSRK